MDFPGQTGHSQITQKLLGPFQQIQIFQKIQKRKINFEKKHVNFLLM
jgi:hypothetical protein